MARTYEIGPGAGRVLVKTGRVGLAARAGHDLTLEITKWSARVTVPADEDGGEAAATVTAELDLSSLVVRAGTGGAKALSDRDRVEILGTARRVLGEAPKASYGSSHVIPSVAGGGIDGTLTMRGRSQPVRLQVIKAAPGRYRGSAVVKQTDFGITPYSGLFGALKLKDEVTVEFEVELGGNPNGPS